jgi:hypothetical protein
MTAASVAPAPICGEVRCTGSVEWICVRAPHPDKPGRRKKWTPPNYPMSEQHHMVRRYPVQETA